MDIDQTTLALAALAQPTRLETFRLLVRREPEGLPAGDIARDLAVPHNTMSSHLNVLSRAGLVRSERNGRYKFHYADFRPLRAVVDRWPIPEEKS